MADLEGVLAEIDTWGAEHASVAVLDLNGPRASRGDRAARYRWASVTKIVTALTVLVASERGLLGLDEPAGPPGSTVRHLLAHASGLAFDGSMTLAAPGARRIYSNACFDVLGALIAERTGAPFEAAMESFVLDPLGMTGTRLLDRPSQGLHGPLADLAALTGELLGPTLVSAALFSVATSVAFPGLIGLLPGVGRFDPLDWGLGLELHDGKRPHWMGERNSPATYGHFGGSGTFMWVDPVAGIAVATLTDRDFGPWALEAWPGFSDRVLAAVAR
jgi:CubicO group peptidase (beta-lactamase class C family)